MYPEVKGAWVAALRSKKYPQTKGTLHRALPDPDPFYAATEPVGYCCLGVFCELAVAAGVIQRADIDIDGRQGYRTVGSDGVSYVENGVLPREVMEWAGVGSSHALPDFECPQEHGGWGGRKTSLPPLNDHGVSFEEIADIIERLA